MDSRQTSTQTYYRAKIKYCSYAERCTFDVKKKLIEWKVDDKFHKKILDRLTEEGYINNSRYMGSYVSGKFANNKWGGTKNKIQSDNQVALIVKLLMLN